jgi:hypothetical protein
MKFAAVFFDWGDTLSVVSKKSDALVVKTNDWIASMIHLNASRKPLLS